GVLARYYRMIAVDTVRERVELELAERSEPNSPETIAARGYRLAGGGRREEALRELDRAATLDPRNAERWLSIAFIHQLARNLPAAQTAAERASAIAPTEPTFYV